MVSKLLLAVQECCIKAVNEGASDAVIGKMLDHYYEIQAGIGAHKSPKLYGAVPTDPYSHTPATKGAQQPGMTGQVKEDILSRFGELGIVVENGILCFKPSLLRNQEFLKNSQEFEYIDLNNHKQSLSLNAGSLAFTYCQVPVVYTLSDKKGVQVTYSDGSEKKMEESCLDKATSQQLFQRTQEVKHLEVYINK